MSEAEAENVVLMRRWFDEIWNEGRLETIDELLAPEAVGLGQVIGGEPVRGPAGFKPFVERIRGAFPDIRLRVEDAFASGDRVAVRWSATMTHTGDHLGIRASGNTVQITGVSIIRIAGGKIVEGWDNWDQLGMMQAIGAVNLASIADAA